MALLGRAVSHCGALVVLEALCERHFGRAPHLLLGAKPGVIVPSLDEDLEFHGRDLAEAAFFAIVELCRVYGYSPFARTLRSLLTRR